MSDPDRTSPILTLPSFLALWPACYTLGVYMLSTLGLGLDPPGWHTTLYLLLLAHACYLLDRVKLNDARQDPADAIALPQRALLFAQHSRPIRALLVIELLLASIIGWLITPALALVPFCALLGVHLYAGRAASPARPRFKDLPALKSFFISSAHIALVIAVLWGNGHTPIVPSEPRLLTILAGLWLIVSADAILCDLDDQQSDALYATRSLPVLLGAARAWLLAQSLLMLGCALLIIPSQMSNTQALLVACIFASALPTLRMKNRRDLVDARLLPIVLIAMSIP